MLYARDRMLDISFRNVQQRIQSCAYQVTNRLFYSIIWYIIKKRKKMAFKTRSLQSLQSHVIAKVTKIRNNGTTVNEPTLKIERINQEKRTESQT